MKNYMKIFYFIAFHIRLHVRFDKINGLEFVMALDIQYYLEVKNMLPFTRRLYIL